MRGCDTALEGTLRRPMKRYVAANLWLTVVRTVKCLLAAYSHMTHMSLDMNAKVSFAKKKQSSLPGITTYRMLALAAQAP